MKWSISRIDNAPIWQRPARILLFVFITCTTLAGCGNNPDDPASTTSTSEIPRAAGDLGETLSRVPVEVIEVIDGDTIRVTIDGRSELVRLIGIDSPETDGPYREPECYGDEATALITEAFSAADIVALEQDQTDRDRFDRLLRYVWLDPDGASPVLLNELLVSRGAAFARAYPPNVRYQQRLEDAEANAGSRQAGLWGSCE